jgi:hypothetical protein
MQGNASYAAEKYGPVWRLLNKPGEDSAEWYEVVVSFQGILCNKDMAPCNEKNM